MLARQRLRHLRKTRFRLLVRLYRTGFSPARSRRKVSDLLPYISSSLPKLGLAQTKRPQLRRAIADVTNVLSSLATCFRDSGRFVMSHLAA